MRTQDIKIGEYYRHRDHPNYAYAKAVLVIKPMPKYKADIFYWGLSDELKATKITIVKCEWTVNKNDSFGMIKYFRPCDLVKCEEK